MRSEILQKQAEEAFQKRRAAQLTKQFGAERAEKILALIRRFESSLGSTH